MDNKYAIGILAPVKMVTIIDDIYVLPRPLNAPLIIISKHINNWEYPNIFKYIPPLIIASSSSINKVKIFSPQNTKINVVIIPNPIAVRIPILQLLFILS